MFSKELLCLLKKFRLSNIVLAAAFLICFRCLTSVTAEFLFYLSQSHIKTNNSSFLFPFLDTVTFPSKDYIMLKKKNVIGNYYMQSGKIALGCIFKPTIVNFVFVVVRLRGLVIIQDIFRVFFLLAETQER